MPIAVPPVSTKLAERTWTRDALCATEEQSNQTWIVTVSNGRESPSTVAARFGVCAECPVRQPCLDDAVTEERFTIAGVWGGTVTTERVRAVGEARKQDRDASESEIRARAAVELESTFQSRLAIWEHLAGRGVVREEPRATKRTVAVGVAWT